MKFETIKFKNNVKIFVGTCYSMCVFLILIMFFMMELNKYLLLLIIPFIVSFVYQVKIFKVFNSESCLLAFKNNNLIGSLIFIFIFSFNIL